MTVQYPQNINVVRQDSFSTNTYDEFSTVTGSLKHIDLRKFDASNITIVLLFVFFDAFLQTKKYLDIIL